MYRQGDPGFFSNLWGGIKGAVVGYVTSGFNPAGAVVGAVGGYASAAAAHPAQSNVNQPYGGVGPVPLPRAQPMPYGPSPSGAQYAMPGGAYGMGTAQQFAGGIGAAAPGPWGPMGFAGYAPPTRARRQRFRKVCYRVPY